MNRRILKKFCVSILVFSIPVLFFSYGSDSSAIYNHYSAIQNLKHSYFPGFHDFLNSIFVTGESNLSEIIKPLLQKNNNDEEEGDILDSDNSDDSGYYSAEPVDIEANKAKLLKTIKLRTSVLTDYFSKTYLDESYPPAQGNLSRLYGETLFGCKFLDFTGAAGFSGVMYAGYTGNASFNLPQDDLLSYVSYSEFSGTERLDNLMNIAFGFKDYFWAEAYLFLTTNYAPADFVFGSTFKSSYISFFGFDVQFENLLNADIMFGSTGKIKEFSLHLNPYETVLSVLGEDSKIDLTTKIGFEWKCWDELLNNSYFDTGIIWSDFAIPMESSYTKDFGIYRVSSATSFCVHLENSQHRFYLESFDQKIDFSRLFTWNIDESAFYFRVGLITCFSFYQNEKLLLYGNLNTPWYLGIKAGLYFSPVPRDYMRFEIDWKLNYIDDLKESLGAVNNFSLTAKVSFNL